MFGPKLKPEPTFWEGVLGSRSKLVPTFWVVFWLRIKSLGLKLWKQRQVWHVKIWACFDVFFLWQAKSLVLKFRSFVLSNLDGQTWKTIPMELHCVTPKIIWTNWSFEKQAVIIYTFFFGLKWFRFFLVLKVSVFMIEKYEWNKQMCRAKSFFELEKSWI